MEIFDLSSSAHARAGDETLLVELVHPKNMDTDPGCSIAHAKLLPGEKSLPHRLRTSAEVYYLLSGEGVMHIDAESARLAPGQAVLIPAGALQWIENTGSDDLVFLAVVVPPWRAEDEEICR